MSRIARSHPLDNPVYSALTGPHAHFAQRRGNALRYPVDMSTFMALPDTPDDAGWREMAMLAGPGASVTLTGLTIEPPAGWKIVTRGAVLQLVDGR
jgi:hypothetical protein